MARRQQDGGRQPAITLEAMVAAGLAVLERDGLDDLTMRRVAAELGVQAASLYWHVQGKEELLDLMADALVGGVDLSTPPGDWREQTRVLAHRYRAHLKSRRDAARVVSGRLVMGPNAAAKMEDSLRLLCKAGFSPGGAAAATFLISVNYVQGFVIQETASLRSLEAPRGSGPGQVSSSMSARLAALPAAAFPRLAEASPYLTTLDLDERFDWGLECILDGLELRLVRARGGPGVQPTP